MGKAKPRMHEIVNPAAPRQESKKERKKRERLEQALRAAAFAATPEQLQYRQENLPRHAGFDDERRKGGRSNQKRRAIRDDE